MIDKILCTIMGALLHKGWVEYQAKQNKNRR